MRLREGTVTEATTEGLGVTFITLTFILSHQGRGDLGRAEGRSPSAFPLIPQDWGAKGVEEEFCDDFSIITCTEQ
jgi:hypothetical protein